MLPQSSFDHAYSIESFSKQMLNFKNLTTENNFVNAYVQNADFMKKGKLKCENHYILLLIIVANRMNIFLDPEPYGILQYSNGNLVVISLHSRVTIY